MTNLIMCGGIGSRLWPLSRTSLPKQFYPLFGGRTLFEATVARNKPLVDRFWVASNRAQLAMATEQLSLAGVPEFGALIEAVGRNTAPAIALVCQALPPDEVVLVTPADHLITRNPEYQRAVLRATALAEENFVVIFGIRPTYPETGFGYIEADGDYVVSFKEKPDAARAKEFFASGRHLWNSGILVVKAGVFLNELGRCEPALLAACRRVRGLEPSLAEMESIPCISVDHAVLEKSDKVRVVPCDPGWHDLGSFDSLTEAVEPGPGGNSFLGDHPPEFVDSKNNFVFSTGRKVVLLDVEDLMVIDTPDALLVLPRGSGQKVKSVVEGLQKGGSQFLD